MEKNNSAVVVVVVLPKQTLLLLSVKGKKGPELALCLDDLYTPSGSQEQTRLRKQRKVYYPLEKSCTTKEKNHRKQVAHMALLRVSYSILFF